MARRTFKAKKSNQALQTFILGIVVGFLSTWTIKDEFPLPSKSLGKKSEPTAVLSPLPFSLPASSPLLKRLGYTMAYDGKNRNPSWVFEHLTPDRAQGQAEAHRFKAIEDESIPKHLRSTIDDYFGSGFKQGRLCPAGDAKSRNLAMYETFYLSNTAPTNPSLSLWEQLEKKTRDWSERFKNLYVVTGPLYLPKEEMDGRRYVKYRVIGPNDVAVPTHFFKAILAEKYSGDFQMCGFLVPNEEIAPDAKLEEYLVSVQKLETVSGLEFFKTEGRHLYDALKREKPEFLW